MRTALRKMGNSTGMIVPKAILREAGVEAGADLELTVVEGAIVARPARHPREGWAEDAKAMADAGEDGLVWPEFGNKFDEEEWTWPGLDEDVAR